MLYNDIDFEKAFLDPPCNYRGTPFWSWNSELNESELSKQIEIFKEMGFGGFHIHSRIGLNIQYLGNRFMELVKHCNEEAKKRGMLTWLYDEDKWPSGFGGGLVTSDVQFRIRYLLISPHAHEDGFLQRGLPEASRVNMDGDCTYLCSYEVQLSNGYLKGYRKVDKLLEPSTGSQIWHVYKVISGPTSWFNDQSYIDTLNPEATKLFTKVTHEVYDATLHEEFGKSVPAMFTDEPQYFRMQNFSSGTALQEVGIPFTDGLDLDYFQAYGESLFEKLPEIFWNNLSGEYSQTRYRYFNILSERFSNSYCKILDEWCTAHGILSTGHLMGESSLDLQSRLCGEAMRSYRSFKLPGIDILANRYEYMTAKQAQSTCHQFGAPGVLSELYGVTNWDFDFRGHKLQGDWQAALGVTVRVHHLAWATMAGESKRDYPAPIDQHSTWYREYRSIEDHFSRVNVALTRGKPIVRIGVLHPIESYWLAFGPDDQTAATRRRLEEQFEALTTWLLFNQLDFDYVAESLLPDLYTGTEKGTCSIGQSTYDVLVIPELLTIRQSSLDMLESFASEGGKIIYLGKLPEYIDAKRIASPKSFVLPCENIGFDQWNLIGALAAYRAVEIFDETRTLCTDLLYQLREEGNTRYLFIAHGRTKNRLQQKNFRSDEDFSRFFRIKGKYAVTLLNTFTGDTEKLAVVMEDDWTCFSYPLYAHDSILLKLEKPESSDSAAIRVPPRLLKEKIRLRTCSSYSLEEKNVLVLDQAQYSLDGEDFVDAEEILRLEDSIRLRCGYSIRSEAFPQPWLVPEEESKPHKVSLRFEIESEISHVPISLACETPDALISLNGSKAAKFRPDGYFVDPCLQTASIGSLKKGRNILDLIVPYGRKTNLEWCYLLGNFGVDLEGERARIIKEPKQIGFGDITSQGFPFYGGNISYTLQVSAQAGRWMLKVPQYVGALLVVTLDGRRMGQIIGEPYSIDLGMVSNRIHEIQITCFGTRFNTFGQLHNSNRFEAYFGPKSWRSTNEQYSYIYQIKSAGILIEPFLEILEE